jgi:hypothetical protein
VIAIYASERAHFESDQSGLDAYQIHLAQAFGADMGPDRDTVWIERELRWRHFDHLHGCGGDPISMSPCKPSLLFNIAHISKVNDLRDAAAGRRLSASHLVKLVAAYLSILVMWFKTAATPSANAWHSCRVSAKTDFCSPVLPNTNQHRIVESER